ncbi:MAG: hypothetical protein SPJ44_10185 [Treponema sp.]|nr:hypothetical protein [Treponema sp.]
MFIAKKLSSEALQQFVQVYCVAPGRKVNVKDKRFAEPYKMVVKSLHRNIKERQYMVSTETVLGLKEVLISTSLDMKNHDYFFAISSENLKICSEKYGCKC